MDGLHKSDVLKIVSNIARRGVSATKIEVFDIHLKGAKTKLLELYGDKTV
jgi:hypothetical protein